MSLLRQRKKKHSRPHLRTCSELWVGERQLLVTALHSIYVLQISLCLDDNALTITANPIVQYYLNYYALGPLRPAETHHYQKLHYQADSHIYDATKKNQTSNNSTDKADSFKDLTYFSEIPFKCNYYIKQVSFISPRKTQLNRIGDAKNVLEMRLAARGSVDEKATYLNMVRITQNK